MATKKRITAAQILQRTITDFTKHPERWIQHRFGEAHKKDVRDLQAKPLWNLFDTEREKAERKSPKVTKPGNGKKKALDIFNFSANDLFGQAQQYCGLGGIEQNAWRLNKAHFWDNDFQRELAWVGVILDWKASLRRPAPEVYTIGGAFPEFIDERPPFNNFVDFNDHEETTLAKVLDLMNEAFVYLRKRDAENAKKRERRAAAKVDA